MNITLPDELKADLERRAAGHGMSVDEYVVWLVEEDLAETVYAAEDLGFRSQDELDAFVQASIESGPPVVADDKFWADLRRESEARVEAQKKATRP